MPTDRLPIGVFTTDDRLVVRTWDSWIAAATGIEPARALNRRVADVIPDISPTALAIMEDVLTRGTTISSRADRSSPVSRSTGCSST